MRVQSRLRGGKPGPKHGPNNAERAAKVEHRWPAAEQVTFAEVAGKLHDDYGADESTVTEKRQRLAMFVFWEPLGNEAIVDRVNR